MQSIHIYIFVFLSHSICCVQNEENNPHVINTDFDASYYKHEEKKESHVVEKKKDQTFVRENVHIETLQWAIKFPQSYMDMHNKRQNLQHRKLDSSTKDCIALLQENNDLKYMGSVDGQTNWHLFSHHLHVETFSSLSSVFQNHKEDIIHKMSPVSNVQFKENISNSDSYPRSQHMKKEFEEHLLNVHDINSEDWRKLVTDTEHELNKHPCVEFHQQQVAKFRFPRSIEFQDPAFDRQWHLVNRQERGMDINVQAVWDKGYTGQGITVAVVDDGLEWDNPDLFPNYNEKGSWDLNSDDANPMPNLKIAKNHHGTRCAGEIAAAANSVCAVGVAYGAKIAGIRVLDGPMTDVMEAKAFTQGMDVNSIYSCSWGPEDDGQTVDGPDHLASEGLRHGIDYGRHGYGSLYVVASGNGGENKDNCNFDGYANSIFTITIGAVDEQGQMPFYAEECASMLAVTFSSGNGFTRNIVTTDWRYHGGTGCTDSHSGTSAAAPLAAGMIALALEANPCLSWRDVQYLCVVTAKKVDVDQAHWSKNKAHLHHSHKHGFGLMDAWALVNAALVWESVPWQTTFTTQMLEPESEIPVKGNTLTLSHTVTGEDLDGYSLYIIEQVQVLVWISHVRRGDLSISLSCPSGTASVIAAPRPKDRSSAGFTGWTFTTVRCWGEQPEGTYTLTIKDHGNALVSAGIFNSWRIKVHGTPMTSEEFQKRIKLVKKSVSGSYMNKSYSPACSPPPEVFHYNPVISDKWLKILAMSSVFCLVMALYETFEYAFCYNDEKAEEAKRRKLWRRAQSLYNGTPTTQPPASMAEYIPLEDVDELSLQELGGGIEGAAAGAEFNTVEEFNTSEYDAYWNSEDLDLGENSQLLSYQR